MGVDEVPFFVLWSLFSCPMFSYNMHVPIIFFIRYNMKIAFTHTHTHTHITSSKSKALDVNLLFLLFFLNDNRIKHEAIFLALHIAIVKTNFDIL
jgi:hypothetical protein